MLSSLLQFQAQVTCYYDMQIELLPVVKSNVCACREQAVLLRNCRHALLRHGGVVVVVLVFSFEVTHHTGTKCPMFKNLPVESSYVHT